MQEAAQLITDEALAAGFAAVGFAKAGPSESFDTYHEWLKSGMAADMDYLSRHAELRRHPETVAPGVKSIIAVAARYPTNGDPGQGFSTYARGLDYHDVLRAKLRKISVALGREVPLHVHRICVDSAPLLEREWATRAGLGWQGRQGQLVNPTAGCCFVLGFLLVDIELPASPRIENQCGECQACVRACPTGAALGDGRVDARRCLSYLSIEHHGDIPECFAKPMRGVLFGCDLCTAVCPWNVRASAPIMQELEEMAPLPSPAECLAMTEDQFADRFKGTAVYRRSLTGLKRNARLAGRSCC